MAAATFINYRLPVVIRDELSRRSQTLRIPISNVARAGVKLWRRQKPVPVVVTAPTSAATTVPVSLDLYGDPIAAPELAGVLAWAFATWPCAVPTPTISQQDLDQRPTFATAKDTQ